MATQSSFQPIHGSCSTGLGVGIALLVFIGSFFRMRADLTNEGRYTLGQRPRKCWTA